MIIEEDDEVAGDELEPVVLAEMETQETNVMCDNFQQTTTITSNSVIIRRDIKPEENGEIGKSKKSKINFEKCVAFQPGNPIEKQNPPMISYEKVKRHKQR